MMNMNIYYNINLFEVYLWVIFLNTADLPHTSQDTNIFEQVQRSK